MSDLIDRAAAILIASGFCHPANVAKELAKLPSVQPERKTGQWICSDDMYETAVCSVCKWDTTEPCGHIKLWFKFCPHCGAKMEEGGQE